MGKYARIILYFVTWIALAITAVILNVFNMDWSQTSIFNGVAIVLLLGILQGCVLESPAQTIATLILGGHTRKLKKNPDFEHLTLVLNYNLLATNREEIEECMQMMYTAFMGNLAPNVSAVLVSATGDEELKDYELFMRDVYRVMIFDELYTEGLAYAREDYLHVDKYRFLYVWRHFRHIDSVFFIRKYLHEVCDKYSREFMLVHRVSRVLRKCGQYQDLMLLSAGMDRAVTYCDPKYYGDCARELGKPLFHDSDDVKRILGRKFDYTLVLDGDTGVPPGTVYDLMRTAAAYPEKGIIQPAITLICNRCDTMFMHLESMRQSISEPITNALTDLFGQSSYYGKALIKNDIYIEKILYHDGKLIESVPIDVLSHDTFEASLLHPLYAGSVSLLEAPSYNYVTWDIRERRWNRGEILNAMYFWDNLFGKPMRFLQKIVRRKKFTPTKLRTRSDTDFISSYMSHLALRQMCMKPFLLFFILLSVNISLHQVYLPIVVVMFLIIVFPKFATCNRKNIKSVCFETVASILQFTPEAVVGCVRILMAFYANIVTGVQWIPQRSVEMEFKSKNPFLSAFRHLWGYSTVGIVVGFFLIAFQVDAMFMFLMLVTMVLLPVFTGITSLPAGYVAKYRGRVGIESDSTPSTKYDKGFVIPPPTRRLNTRERARPFVAWTVPLSYDLSIV
ncbi:uncharacterized protein LOC132551442 [Ylistrum balloti]|uniref:uncharacterized protein LOC132551442 n=1 Tax=Ylistrum balloti TaxID=509963 RepID=UPI002905C94A|nr:uncharacterized protein LOC132551442 [Ylistrum balloti]